MQRASIEYESVGEKSGERAKTSMNMIRHPLKTMLRDSTISSSLHDGSLISQIDSNAFNPLKNVQIRSSFIPNILSKKPTITKTAYNISMSTILHRNQLGGGSIEDIIPEDVTQMQSQSLLKDTRSVSTSYGGFRNR